MEEVEITATRIEINKKKDADGGDVFEVSIKRSGKAGSFDIAGSTGGVYSSWERVVEELKDLNLPSRVLNGMKKQLESVDSVFFNMTETPGL
jgi:hypothetical protein